jgi:hypothetical protein
MVINVGELAKQPATTLMRSPFDDFDSLLTENFGRAVATEQQPKP